MKYINIIKRKGLLTCIIYIIINPIYTLLYIITKKILSNSHINEKYIVFSSTPDYSDNALELYKYYISLSKYKNNRFIWLISKESKKRKYDNNKNTIFIRYNSNYHKSVNIRALYFIKKSKLFYFTHTSPFNNVEKNNEQLAVNLWHGCGYKDKRKNSNSNNTLIFDYALVPGKIFIDTKSKYWQCAKNKVLDIGYPRYDLLIKNTKEDILAKEYIKRKAKNNKIIIWMPTFRKTNFESFPENSIKKAFDLPILKSEDELEKLNNICKKNNITIMIKRHPLQAKYNCENNKKSNIIFISNEDLMNERINLYSMLKYTDALITDYSSIGIDYLLLDKPMAFSLDDFNDYTKVRGFVFKNPLEYMPGNYLYNYEDLILYIEDISKGIDRKKEQRKKIIDIVHNPCDNYCKRIETRINEILTVEENKHEKI